jgi:hypothetical protein
MRSGKHMMARYQWTLIQFQWAIGGMLVTKILLVDRDDYILLLEKIELGSPLPHTLIAVPATSRVQMRGLVRM